MCNRIAKRRKTRVIRIGSVKIGGSNPIAIQSMTKTRTCQVDRTVRQIRQLEDAGCDIVRVAVLNMKDARSLRVIKRRIRIPLVADIHFDYRLALEAIDAGVDKIRINPGTMRHRDHIKQVALACQHKHIPMRIGVNSGSLADKQKGISVSHALVRSAQETVRFLNSFHFNGLAVSLKASDVISTINANRLFSKHSNLPVHIGVTASGGGDQAVIKSAACVSTLLVEGIGDTIRISLTDDPVKEVLVAKEILCSLGLRSRDCEVISCPTCGRAEIDVISLAKRVRRELERRQLRFSRRGYKIAIMGCTVNGPGEASEADLGITGGRAFGFIFKKGKVFKKVPRQKLIKAFLKELEKCAGHRR